MVAFTKDQQNFLESYGFKYQNGVMSHHNGHRISKTSERTFDSVFNYPGNSKPLKSESINFETIELFVKRFHKRFMNYPTTLMQQFA